jgi:hypothetical protein
MDDKTDVNLPKQGIEYIMRVEKHVSEPWFSDPCFCKTGGGRLCEFASLSKNDTIVWVNEDFGFKRTVRTKVTFVNTPPSQVLANRGVGRDLAAHG